MDTDKREAMTPTPEFTLAIHSTLAKWAFLEHPTPDLIDGDLWEDLRKLTDTLEDALTALAVLADWPRISAMADGQLSSNPEIGLANVRRYARTHFPRRSHD